MNVKTKEINREMFRGDTHTFTIQLLDKNKTPIELNDAFLSCKASNKDNIYVFQKTIGNGITQIKDGIYRFKINPSDTENIKCMDYIYDIEIKMNEDVFTIMYGKLKVREDVTRHNGE